MKDTTGKTGEAPPATAPGETLDMFARFEEVAAEQGEAEPEAARGADVLSFSEHKAKRLAERNTLLSTRMRELVGIARENESLSAHLHHLSLALLGADTLAEVMARVYTTLREDVGVELGVVALYVPPREPEDTGLDEMRPSDDPVRERFQHVFERNLPACGPLSPVAAAELVGLRGADFASAALVPIGRPPFGLLALLSRDPERYHASMGKVFLRRTGDLLAAALEPHVQLPRSGRPIKPA